MIGDRNVLLDKMTRLIHDRALYLCLCMYGSLFMSLYLWLLFYVFVFMALYLCLFIYVSLCMSLYSCLFICIMFICIIINESFIMIGLCMGLFRCGSAEAASSSRTQTISIRGYKYRILKKCLGSIYRHIH